MKGVKFSTKGVRKGYLFSQKWYIRGEGFGPRGGASPYKTLLSSPPPGLDRVQKLFINHLSVLKFPQFPVGGKNQILFFKLFLFL